MHYVYIISSQIKRWKYIGSCSDLKKRFDNHNDGKVISTKKYKPFELVYYECFRNKEDALMEEKFLKTGKGRERIGYALKNSLQ